MTYPPCSNPGCMNDGKTIVLFVTSERTSSEVAVCDEHFHNLDIEYLLRNPRQIDERSFGISHEDCRLHALLFLRESERYAIVLSGRTTDSILMFQTGYVQASLLYIEIKNASGDSPFIHELFLRLAHLFGGSIEAAVIDGFVAETNTYVSHLRIETDHGPVKVKCRASDAVGISHFAGVPIEVDSALLGQRVRGTQSGPQT